MPDSAVVIGAGFGGIASAIRLRAMNYNVTLIEKNSDLGGRARTFYKNGYTFDAGPTVITAPYLLDELFSLFKKDIKDYVKIIPLKIWYQFIFSDLSKFNYTGNHNENLKELCEKKFIDWGFKNTKLYQLFDESTDRIGVYYAWK